MSNQQKSSGQKRGIEAFLRPVSSNVGTSQYGAKSSKDAEPQHEGDDARKRVRSQSSGTAEEESIPPAPATGGKIGSIIKDSTEQSERKVVGWLNKLTPGEARAVELALLSQNTLESRRQITGLSYAALRGLRNDQREERSGSWYADTFGKCLVPVSKAGPISRGAAVTAKASDQGGTAKTSASHGRYQVRINVSTSAAIYNQMSVALTRLGRQRALDLMAEFRGIPSKPDSQDAIVKIGRHQLAYVAGRRDTDALIPHNLGSGASISHLCDTMDCIEKSHLVLEIEHRENLVRQRCKGVLLIVSTWNRLILQEEPCVHGVEAAQKLSQHLVGLEASEAQSLSRQLALSCRKVQVVDIGSSRDRATALAARLESP